MTRPTMAAIAATLDLRKRARSHKERTGAAPSQETLEAWVRWTCSELKPHDVAYVRECCDPFYKPTATDFMGRE